MGKKTNRYRIPWNCRTAKQHCIPGIILLLFFISGCTTAEQSAALITYKKKNNSFEITYRGEVIAMGTITRTEQTGTGDPGKEQKILLKTEKKQKENGALTQEFLFSGTDPESIIRMSGNMKGPGTFLCAPGEEEALYNVIRTSSGMSRSGLNTGIYSTVDDWALYFRTTRGLELYNKTDDTSGLMFSFSIQNRGPIVLTFTPHLYKDHRGLSFYDPSRANRKETVPCGWISWKAYGGGITETDVKTAADWCAEHLGDYGLEYIIIDDGWFKGGRPSGQMYNVPPGIDWTGANNKFPSGIQHLTGFIHDRGLKAGIWISPFGFSGDPNKNPDYWIRTGAGKEFLYNEWHGFHYCDSTHKDAVTNWLTRGITAQVKNSVDLFKLDGMFHVAYEGYQNTGDFFTAKGYTWQTALRMGWNALYNAAGGNYVLSCWGRVPEIAGIPDAIRIGQDKDSRWIYIPIVAEDLYKYLYEHTIIWCDDPDHIVFRDLSIAESRTWATLVGMTGTLLTFSDRPENMTPEKLSIIRKIVPVINTPAVRPLNLFSYPVAPRLWTMEIDREFDHWLVAANTTASGTVDEINFEAIGLEPDKDYTVFDFWNGEFRGIYRNSFFCGTPGYYDSSVYCIKELRPYPWVMSVNRHISQGGVSIETLGYDRDILSGSSKVVKNDPYSLYLYTHGKSIESVRTTPQVPHTIAVQGHSARLTLTSPATTTISWEITFGEINPEILPLENKDLNPAMANKTIAMETSLTDGVLYLSDREWKSSNNGWGPVEKDMSNGESGSGDGKPMTIAGTPFTKGLGIHAESTIRYSLNKQFSRFKAFIGIDDETMGTGTVIFRVYADGEQLFESPIIQGGDPPREVDCNIAGKQELTLVVTDAGDGIAADHGNWAEARIIQ